MLAGAIALSDGSVALAATLVLPPALSLLSVRFALRRDESYNAAQWIRYLRLFRVVPLFTVAMWWSLCDTFPQSGLLRILTSLLSTVGLFLARCGSEYRGGTGDWVFD